MISEKYFELLNSPNYLEIPQKGKFTIIVQYAWIWKSAYTGAPSYKPESSCSLWKK